MALNEMLTRVLNEMSTEGLQEFREIVPDVLSEGEFDWLLGWNP